MFIRICTIALHGNPYFHKSSPTANFFMFEKNGLSKQTYFFPTKLGAIPSGRKNEPEKPGRKTDLEKLR